MKATFFLFFCGLSFVLGEFECGVDYPRECEDPSAKTFPGYGPETEADLEYYCKSAQKILNCQLDFAIQCPMTFTGATRQSLEDHLSFFKRICNKNDVLHKKYLEKVKCLNDERESTEVKCVEAVKEGHYCKAGLEQMRCIVDELLNRCGEDGKELLDTFYKSTYSARKIFCPE